MYKPKPYKLGQRMKIKPKPMSFWNENRPLVKNKTIHHNKNSQYKKTYNKTYNKMTQKETDEVIIFVGGALLLVILIGVMLYLLGFLNHSDNLFTVLLPISIIACIFYSYTVSKWNTLSHEWQEWFIALFVCLTFIDYGLWENNIYMIILPIIFLIVFPFIPSNLLLKLKNIKKQKQVISGYIYAINIGSEIEKYIALKIGKTTRTPKDRLNEYKTGNPYCVLVKAWECYDDLNNTEKQVHGIAKQLSIYHKQEVFYFPDSLSINKLFNSINNFMVYLKEVK